ncbi:polysaccharide deacetylase family protein [Dethiobacter alkaliphilus]|uniref:Polysaccharide deacetylase n=1 Tax=Dethiobacter alkaliphilus AHT 1 TaxID=555088 RepID=C0GK25_DETAL|nr:polysaccharide deacetylase family protein [Dethiobacter alkaliphilus]EEG76295.1 polysaccharide deacetylase [Dethiobacter alkaliphilus AHT 1]
MKNTTMILLACLVLFFITGCNEPASVGNVSVEENSSEEGEIMDPVENDDVPFSKPEDSDRQEEQQMEPQLTLSEIKEQLIEVYGRQVPVQWGERVSGVKNSIDTNDKVIALTFDACGGGRLGNGYDEELIDFLIENNIPATLFISGGWIDNNEEVFAKLAKVPTFSIQNHGYRHRPLSVNGQSAYGIKGTGSVAEVIDEIILNDEKIAEITGKRTQYFRSGTAFYDDVAVNIANELGKTVVNFSVVGDGGARFSQQQVHNAVVRAKPGAIVLLHMNRPDTEIAAGVRSAVLELQKQNVSFVTLDEYHKYLSEEVIN